MSHPPLAIHRSTSLELERPSRDDSEHTSHDPSSDVTARIEGLGRPRMSREDYYDGSRARPEPLPRPSGSRPLSSSGDLGRRNSPVPMPSNTIPSSLLDSVAQDKWPFIYQQQWTPVSGPSLEGPHPPPLIRGGLVTSGPIPSWARPEYTAYGTVPFPTEERPSIKNPPKRPSRPLKRPRPWQPDL
ncbi:hypothetical protein PLICRDRAFT_29168 [Plicaturopsis crispa FD-325 SS-3]|nr:hypothetical protein PLICRDRAFT_29168 [Plicaturopsis crispa FD-325 SS-3]